MLVGFDSERSCLEPNSGSMLVPIEGGSLLLLFAVNGTLKTRTYLERIRNSMQKPIEGLSHGTSVF